MVTDVRARALLVAALTVLNATAQIVGAPAASAFAGNLVQREQSGGVLAAPQVGPGQAGKVLATAPSDRDAVATQKPKSLLLEIAAANGYQDLPPQQRLAKLDDVLTRLQALGAEMAGTRAAPIYQNSLTKLQEERATIAVQAGRDPFAAPGMSEGPYTDFEWLGQRDHGNQSQGGFKPRHNANQDTVQIALIWSFWQDRNHPNNYTE